MSYTHKTIPQSQVEFTFTITPADYEKDLQAAAVRLSERAAITGFRPGKAPYNIVKQQVGEIRILEEALESIIQKTFFAAVKEEKLETVGAPQINVEKLAPGNDLIFKATVALMPKVKLPDLASIKIENKLKEVSDADVETVIKDLQKMRTKEVVKAGQATTADKVVIDMEMFMEKVPVDGGQAKDHHVYLNEPHYIPGFAEQLIGLTKDQTKEFTLPFPKEHYQKHLAGKKVDFKVKVKEVYELQPPEINDDFAKELRQESAAKLRTLLRENLIKEAGQKEEQRASAEMIDKLIAGSTFTDIQKVLIDSEKHRIFHELKHDLEKHGIEMEQYLKDLKKTEEEIFADFTAQATKRAQAALVSRQVAFENDIKVEKTELDAEIVEIIKMYPDNPQVKENLKQHEVLDTLSAAIQNRKVMTFLKKKIS